MFAEAHSNWLLQAIVVQKHFGDFLVIFFSAMLFSAGALLNGKAKIASNCIISR
jgi:hypothetical protein